MRKIRKRILCKICGKKFWFECEWFSDWPKSCPLCGADYVFLAENLRQEKELLKEMFGLR